MFRYLLTAARPTLTALCRLCAGKTWLPVRGHSDKAVSCKSLFFYLLGAEPRAESIKVATPQSYEFPRSVGFQLGQSFRALRNVRPPAQHSQPRSNHMSRYNVEYSAAQLVHMQTYQDDKPYICHSQYGERKAHQCVRAAQPWCAPGATLSAAGSPPAAKPDRTSALASASPVNTEPCPAFGSAAPYTP